MKKSPIINATLTRGGAICRTAHGTFRVPFLFETAEFRPEIRHFKAPAPKYTRINPVLPVNFKMK